MMLGRTSVFALFMILVAMPSNVPVYGAVMLLGIHLTMALMPKERKV